MEKDCYSAVRHSEIETQDILKIRKREEMAIVLETSFFDANDDETKANKRDEAKESSKDVSLRSGYRPIDSFSLLMGWLLSAGQE